jgi:HAD superfamily hydrolase (TIGR01509 family)
VLVDSEILSFKVEAAALAELGVQLTAEDLLGRFLGTSTASMLAQIEREQGIALPPDLPGTILARVRAAFDEELRAIPGMADLVASLTLPICVASSSEPDRVRHSLRIAGVLDRFEPNIFSATMVKRGKPAPDLFLHAAERMATPPRRCLVIEDSVAGITAARAAGMTVLGFTGGSHCLPGQADKLRAAGASEILESADRLARYLAVTFPELDGTA